MASPFNAALALWEVSSININEIMLDCCECPLIVIGIAGERTANELGTMCRDNARSFIERSIDHTRVKRW